MIIKNNQTPTNTSLSTKTQSGAVINRADELIAKHEQRRYEIARTMLPSIYEVTSSYTMMPDTDELAECADLAVRFADVLLTRLARIDNNVSPDDMANSMLQ